MRATSIESGPTSVSTQLENLGSLLTGRNSAQFIADKLVDPENPNRKIEIKDINDHFDFLRTLSKKLYGFESPRLALGEEHTEDRFADNLNVIFDCFDLNDNSTADQNSSRVKQFQKFAAEDLTPFAEFLRRTPSDNFKVLVYRLNIKSISDMKSLLDPNASGFDNDDIFKIEPSLAEVPSHVLNFMLCTKQGLSPLEFRRLYLSSEGQSVKYFLSEVPVANSCFLSASREFADIYAINKYLSDHATRTNLSKCDLPRLAELAVLIGIAPEDKFDFVLDAISSFYDRSLETHVAALVENNYLKHAHASLYPLIQAALKDRDYGKQNLYAISTLVSRGRLQNEQEVIELEKLIILFNGFVTPTLAERIFDADNDSAKTEVLAKYQKLQNELLGSSPVDIYDIPLLAEAIFIAYRPTGFDIPRIIEVISNRQVEDLSHHLNRIVVREEGYPMRLRRIKLHQTEEFDYAKLCSADNLLMQSYKEPQASSIIACLRLGKNDLESRASVLASILQGLNDPRITAYQSTYHGVISEQRSFDEKRLESLIDILSVIPDEDLFADEIARAIEACQIDLSELDRQADILRWKANKGRFSKGQVEEKKALDILIRTLESSDSPLNHDSLKDLSDTLIGSDLRESLYNMEASAAAEALKARRSEFYLSRTVGASNSSCGVEAVTEALREEARKFLAQIKSEKKKIISIASEQYDEVRAYISKNVGSFFAKAGAEICTASNFAMWREKRHFHLDIPYEGQIIWNNMLYFEESEELSPYLIARGINPRKDTMLIYDRRSMAEEITRVLGVIAADNNKPHTYITEQTDFYPLSNRDGMAFEMTAVSRRAQQEIKSIDPSIPTVIQSRSFSYKTTPLYSDDARKPVPLILLTSSRLSPKDQMDSAKK